MKTLLGTLASLDATPQNKWDIAKSNSSIDNRNIYKERKFVYLNTPRHQIQLRI